MDFKRIKAEYIAGGTSYRKLAEKHGVSFSTLRKVAAKEQWTELRNKTRTKTDTKISENVSNIEADKAVNIIEVADTLLRRIEELAKTANNSNTIKRLASAMKDIKDIKGIKSEADIREQRARIKKLEMEAERGDDNGKKDMPDLVITGLPEEFKR